MQNDGLLRGGIKAYKACCCSRLPALPVSGGVNSRWLENGHVRAIRWQHTKVADVNVLACAVDLRRDGETCAGELVE